MSDTREVLVLGRSDHAEAMRVAAGLTIFGHRVRLVFMTGLVEDSEANAEQAELLELAEIEPESTVPGEELPHVDARALAGALAAADVVITL